ncbi:cupin [Serratia sp. MYb239]|uniref:cupin domain-containing protein n=1 Tax=Serratia sp. MYb239 TaxID=2033438 RepID=UPI000CF72923|nr:cupin domain-containing protein [Serratia sp. MYb239]AVJ15703.1 cupin [Serratia sp. MYb239]MCA4824924.1 cupin domain-containing protein [Serratia rubidaea]SQJ03419.1 Quercetin 2,3-dioxygenase [Serratia rubidaea]
MNKKINQLTDYPLHVKNTAGEPVWLSGDVYSVKLTNEQTGGKISFIDSSVPPGGGPPEHIHADSDEIIFVAAGEVEITVGENRYAATQGDLVYIPRNTPHCFSNLSLHYARLLFYFNPAGIEKFFIEAGKPASAGILPPVYDDEHNKNAVAIGIKYNTFQKKNHQNN